MTKAKRWSLSSMPEPVVLASDYDDLRLQLSRAKGWMQHKSDCCAPKAGERDCCCGLKEFLKEADGE